MKALKKSFPFILLIICAFGYIPSAKAQKSPTTKEVAVKNMVDSQQYVFYAQSVTPMSGRQRFLTSEYTVNVAKDTIVSDLPFFGRAYSAPLDPTDGGIKFTSTNFDYQASPKKKGGWEISIKPKDASDVQQFNITIYENGTAYLQITSTNRQSISFNGYIAEKKLNRKKVKK